MKHGRTINYTVLAVFVFLAIAKFRRLARSGRQSRLEAEERAAEEARRSTVEERMRHLCEAARLSESCFEKRNPVKEAAKVNGQVHKAPYVNRPKSAHDYRRVWKERPQGFPIRQEL